MVYLEGLSLEEATRSILKKNLFLKISQNSEKTFVPELFYNKIAGFSLQHYLKEALVQVFSCELHEIFKNIFFTKHLHATAFASLWTICWSYNCHAKTTIGRCKKWILRCQRCSRWRILKQYLTAKAVNYICVSLATLVHKCRRVMWSKSFQLERNVYFLLHIRFRLKYLQILLVVYQIFEIFEITLSPFS